MDEPLSNLDANLRVSMRASLAQLHTSLGVTSIYVTHDQTEAMTLGQRVAVMRDGRIVQTDAPQHLYESPRDLFVAAFIGSPAMNLVEAAIEGDEAVFGQFRVPLEPGRRPARGIERAILGARPEAFEDAAIAPESLPRIDVRVELLEELGSEVHAIFRVDAQRVIVSTRDTPDETAGLVPEETSLFTARLDPRTRAPARGPFQLAVDPAGFHFFDVATGESLLAPQRSLVRAGRDGTDHPDAA
jgi:multiple sugar transport system ATP-binding protein